METIEVTSIETPQLDSPVLLEGLPGVGLVGKLAVDHLIEELDGWPVRRLYSEHFPPAISVDDEGTATLPSLTVYAIDTEGRDLLVLAGDTQAQGTVGQYRLADATLDVAGEFDAGTVVGLGGFGTGEQVQDYVVVGAVAGGDDALKGRLEEAGVRFRHEQSPGNIVGMSGLLVGLGGRRGLDAAGLLGITHGYHVDPASARAVLEVLQETFGFDVALDTLDEQAEKVQQLLEHLQQMQQQQQQQTGQSGEDLRYFF